MTESMNTADIPVGVVGLGLMGSSITVALLMAGHPVLAIAPIEGEKESASQHIRKMIEQCEKDDLLNKAPEDYLKALTISDDFHDLDDCRLVLECVSEEWSIKSRIYEKIELVVNKDTVLATNTSAIPISTLQQQIAHPERFIGIHWAEPAFTTRFMEITRGDNTSETVAKWVYNLAHDWGKEPTLLRKDIKGFITNRLMYAVTREILHLIEEGEVSMEDADKSLRYDAGSWITMMGLFRRMDFMGLEDYKTIFDRVFPLLNNEDGVPEVMKRMVAMNARGIQDGQGLYHYTKKEAVEWEEAFTSFSKDIYELAAQYGPEDQNRN